MLRDPQCGPIRPYESRREEPRVRDLICDVGNLLPNPKTIPVDREQWDSYTVRSGRHCDAGHGTIDIEELALSRGYRERLIYWKREWRELGRPGPLADLTFRLYRFSAGLGVIAVLSGAWLAFGWWGMQPWLHLKLTLVVLLGAHYIWTGVLVARARRGEFRESDLFLRLFNEGSVVIIIAILWAVVSKPF